MTQPPADIEELLQRARSGDELAFAGLVRAVRARVVRWAMIITRDNDDAEDVAQQVTLTLHRKLGGFEAKSSFTTWLYGVVRNAAIDTTRTAARKREQPLDETVAPERMTEGMEQRVDQLQNERAATIVRAYMSELPARQRELLELIDREGLSVPEAASVMGIEPETARVHLLRARRTIRTRMLASHSALMQERMNGIDQ